MGTQLLLLDDVDDLGRSGDVVNVKPGYARNYLLPKKKGVVANRYTLRLQAKLKEERIKRAENERKASEELAARFAGTELEIEVKVDPEGHMYGSVSVLDIIRLFEQQGVQIEKRNVVLPHPIKVLGVHELQLKLKEGVAMPFILKVVSDIPLPMKAKEELAEETKDAGEATDA